MNHNLAEFLLMAKKTTYASNLSPLKPSSRPGSKDLGVKMATGNISISVWVILTLLAKKLSGAKPGRFGE